MFNNKGYRDLLTDSLTNRIDTERNSRVFFLVAPLFITVKQSLTKRIDTERNSCVFYLVATLFDAVEQAVTKRIDTERNSCVFYLVPLRRTLLSYYNLKNRHRA